MAGEYSSSFATIVLVLVVCGLGIPNCHLSLNTWSAARRSAVGFYSLIRRPAARWAAIVAFRSPIEIVSQLYALLCRLASSNPLPLRGGARGEWGFVSVRRPSANDVEEQNKSPLRIKAVPKYHGLRGRLWRDQGFLKSLLAFGLLPP